jgi:hypothetical protein
MKNDSYYRNGILRTSGSTNYFYLVSWAGGTDTSKVGFTYFLTTSSPQSFKLFWEVKGYVR